MIYKKTLKKVNHTITDSMRRQAQMEIAHGESFRHDALRVKSLEKELDRARKGVIII